MLSCVLRRKESGGKVRGSRKNRRRMKKPEKFQRKSGKGFPNFRFCNIMGETRSRERKESAVEKRRIRLEINGVVCGLITQESEEYMESLAAEVGDMMKAVLDSSPFVTREAAALTAALSYCDDAKKNGAKAFQLQERIDELEVEAEIWQEEKAAMEQQPPAAQADPGLADKLRQLEERNTVLEETAGRLKELEEKAARLEDENAVLAKTGLAKAGEPAPDEEVRELTKQLTRAREELDSLREQLADRESREKETEREKTEIRRGNPLRHGDELDREGFVSFFEKK